MDNSKRLTAMTKYSKYYWALEMRWEHPPRKTFLKGNDSDRPIKYCDVLASVLDGADTCRWI
jgi:hypothetical protein